MAALDHVLASQVYQSNIPALPLVQPEPSLSDIVKIVETSLNFIIKDFCKIGRTQGGREVYKVTTQFGDPKDNKVWTLISRVFSRMDLMRMLYVYNEIYNLNGITKEEFDRFITISQLENRGGVSLSSKNEKNGFYSASLSERQGNTIVEIPNASKPNQGNIVVISPTVYQELMDTLINIENYQMVEEKQTETPS